MKIGKRCRFYPCNDIRLLISSNNKLDELIYLYGLFDRDNIRQHDLAELNCDLCMMHYFREEMEKNPDLSTYFNSRILQFEHALRAIEDLYRFKQDNEPAYKRWWRRVWRYFC